MGERCVIDETFLGERRGLELKQSIGELLGLVRRNVIVLIAVVGIGIGLSVAYALSRPSIFETSVKVLIESPQIPDELARSTASMPTAGRLQMIEQRLMARAQPGDTD